MVHNVSHPVRAGLYGAGAFGRFIVRSLAGSFSVRVAAVASRTRAHAEALARQEGVGRVHGSYESLLGDRDLDLVLLTTPPSEHARQAMDALAAGKHVLVEKPLATTVDAAEQLVLNARARGLVLAVDHPMLYTPLIEALMLFNTSRLVGPLVGISVENIASCQALGDDHWFWKREISGGIFVEHGVHFFDWCGRMAVEAERVVALASSHGTREDQVFAVVAHTGGTIASYLHAFIAKPESERTRTVLSYEDVDLVLDGWIPTRLHTTGPGAALATTTIRRMLRRTVESIPDARVGFYFDAGAKSALYAEALRAVADDVARAIREPGYEARCAARRVLPSLHVACAARDAADVGNARELRLR